MQPRVVLVHGLIEVLIHVREDRTGKAIGCLLYTSELVSIGLAVHRILGAHLEDEVELLFAADAVGIVDVAIGWSCKSNRTCYP